MLSNITFTHSLIVHSLSDLTDIKKKKDRLTHPHCDSVVRHCFQVAQRRGTLRHPVELFNGRPQPGSVHAF